jgi:hypothetical protein
MTINLPKVVSATLAASVIAVSAGACFAEEGEHRAEARDHDKDIDHFAARRDGVFHQWRQDGRTLREWRDKLAYDQAHYASRKQLAEDENAIAQREGDMRSRLGLLFASLYL